MNADHVILAVVGLIGATLGFIAYRAARRHRQMKRQWHSPSYAEVQRRMDRRSGWAMVIAVAFAIIGMIACFMGR